MSIRPSPDLFGTTPTNNNPLLGVAVRLPHPCRHCGSDIAEIGDGKGPHAASLHCAQCGSWRHWMGREACDFVAETIKHFGRPAEPIAVRHGRPKTT